MVVPSSAHGLILAGPSSSGKSSLALALQSVLPEPWLFLPADRLTAGFPRHREEFVSIDWDRRLRRGCVLAARGFLEAELNVILEQYLWEPWARKMAAEVLSPLPVFVIRLQCELETLEKREARRSDIFKGTARDQSQRWNWDFPHDLVIDSTSEAPATLAIRLADWWSARPSPTALRRMLQC